MECECGNLHASIFSDIIVRNSKDFSVCGVNEKGIDVARGKVLVEVDSKYFRPAEVEQLLGDPTKARTLLGWNPTKTSFPELVKIMVRHDMAKVKRMIATKHD